MPTIDELKYLSMRRLEAADILIKNKVFDIAFHDSGYVVEMGIKATVCKRNGLNEYPNYSDNTRMFFTHHYDSLIKLAGLENELAIKKSKDREFMRNWSVATKWSVNLRYQPIGENQESIAKKYYKAISAKEGGVLPWLQTHW